MSMATDSDPKMVKVRNGYAPSERTRERPTEESLSHIPDIGPPLAVGLVGNRRSGRQASRNRWMVPTQHNNQKKSGHIISSHGREENAL